MAPSPKPDRSLTIAFKNFWNGAKSGKQYLYFSLYFNKRVAICDKW
jgi:hypothetical protein